ncbi:hypothetical protein DFH08DRAFT_828331 [Mycena albidolilacea]|uniref:Uncharacterized protein n=1 Tax=Mycena albidolilacea TaxID=1033008 RepID=A0AAD6YWL7_9AGAR|nr:hypothetical protein DFH08DRAFT_828331 [Mycena albidolilacea]
MTGYTQTDTSKSIPAHLTTTTMKAVYEKAKREHFKGDAENLLQGHGLHSTEHLRPLLLTILATSGLKESNTHSAGSGPNDMSRGREHLVEEVAASECVLHLMDPEVQTARGKAFRQVKYGCLERVVDREVQDFVHGHNCVRDAEARFDEHFAEVKEK